MGSTSGTRSAREREPFEIRKCGGDSGYVLFFCKSSSVQVAVGFLPESGKSNPKAVQFSIDSLALEASATIVSNDDLANSLWSWNSSVGDLAAAKLLNVAVALSKLFLPEQLGQDPTVQ